MTIQPIAIVPSVNDLPNVNEDGPNGASITEKINQVIGVLNPLAEAVDLLVDSPSPRGIQSRCRASFLDISGHHRIFKDLFTYGMCGCLVRTADQASALSLSPINI